MPFDNPITGGQGELVRPAIKSQNYSAGSAGWSINADGSAEFNSLSLRGSETLGDPTVAHIVLNGTTGQIQVYDSGNNLVGQMDANGVEFLTNGAYVRMYEGTYSIATATLVAGGYIAFQPPNQPGVTFNPGVIGSLSFNNPPPGSEMIIASPYQTGQEQPAIYLNPGDAGTNGGGVTLENAGPHNGNFQCTMDAQFTTTAQVAGDYVWGSAAGINNVCGVGSTTSGTYGNLPATSSFSFTKRSATSRIRVEMHATSWCATSISGVRFGVLINGTDYDVCQLAFNSTSFHAQASGVAYVASGLAAGTYTIQGRWKRPSGTGTLNIDTNDWLSISAVEVA